MSDELKKVNSTRGSIFMMDTLNPKKPSFSSLFLLR